MVVKGSLNGILDIALTTNPGDCCIVNKTHFHASFSLIHQHLHEKQEDDTIVMVLKLILCIVWTAYMCVRTEWYHLGSQTPDLKVKLIQLVKRQTHQNVVEQKSSPRNRKVSNINSQITSSLHGSLS